MEREKGKENFQMPLICENKGLGCPVGVSCPGLQDMVHRFPVKASRIPSALLAHLGREWCLSSTAKILASNLASLAKILLPPASPACHEAAPGCGSAHQQAGPSGKGWEAGKGKCFIRDTALSFEDSSGFMSSQCREQPGENQHRGGTAGKPEPNLDVLVQL